MSSDVSGWLASLYQKLQDQEAANIKKVIESELNLTQRTFTETPQNILWYKMASKWFEDDAAFCFKAEHNGEEVYAFNERLVNRLMHFSYLIGCRDIDKKSFEAGKHAYRAEVLKLLDAVEKDEY